MLAVRDDTTIERAVETLRFLSDKNRLRILSALTHAETCVCDLIEELDLAQPLVSYHLGKLRKAGLVRSRREAQWIYYSLDPVAWDELLAPLAGVLSLPALPAQAAFGTNHRCDALPADPEKGACACSDQGATPLLGP